MEDGEILTLTREGVAQGYQTSCPGKGGLEVRWGWDEGGGGLGL